MMAKKAVIVTFATVAAALPEATTPANAAAQFSTVDSYTLAQEADANEAATRAGYSLGPVLFAQDGNFFFNAEKDGHSYELTVTPGGHVYASTPVH